MKLYGYGYGLRTDYSCNILCHQQRAEASRKIVDDAFCSLVFRDTFSSGRRESGMQDIRIAPSSTTASYPSMKSIFLLDLAYTTTKG
jgi:hypothetical protein